MFQLKKCDFEIWRHCSMTDWLQDPQEPREKGLWKCKRSSFDANWAVGKQRKARRWNRKIYYAQVARSLAPDGVSDKPRFSQWRFFGSFVCFGTLARNGAGSVIEFASFARGGTIISFRGKIWSQKMSATGIARQMASQMPQLHFQVMTWTTSTSRPSCVGHTITFFCLSCPPSNFTMKLAVLVISPTEQHQVRKKIEAATATAMSREDFDSSEMCLGCTNLKI